MEKIILLGIAVWFNFVLSDGISPKFSQHAHIYQTAGKSVNKTAKPIEIKRISCIIKDMQPN